jgi:NADH-quinone oxidoreductase subunit C
MISDSLRDNHVIVALGDLADAAKLEFKELTVEVKPENILHALGLIKEELKFEQLTTVTAVDRYPAEPRFEIVYHLHSFSRKERLRLKARLSSENPAIESACPKYRGANWYEREVFDLYGVRFLNHPNLIRIMLPEDWEGYPLRRDYPVTGTRY